MGPDTDVLVRYMIDLLERTLFQGEIPYSIIALVCVVVVILLGVMGAACNIFMFAVIARRPALRRRPVNLLILASCASDTIGSLVSVPLLTFGFGALWVRSVMLDPMMDPMVMIRLLQTAMIATSFCMTNTNLLLLLLVASRYRGVMHPLTTKPYSYKCTALALACTEVFCVLSVIVAQLFPSRNTYYAHICLIFGIATVPMTVMVCRMYRELSAARTRGLLGQVAWAQHARSRRMTMLLYGSYLLTSLPFLVTKTYDAIVDVYAYQNKTPDSDAFYLNYSIIVVFTHLLLFLNGFANLIIYATMCKDIGHAISASLPCLTMFSNSTGVRPSSRNVRDETV